MRRLLFCKVAINGGVMRKSIAVVFFAAVLVSLFTIISASAQERKGSITGRVTDISHDPLVGARVELQPLGQTTTSDARGEFAISDLAPNKYTLQISYVGFKAFSREVSITSGSSAKVEAVLDIGTMTEQVIVRGERERGEIEALNREETADNIVQVLPAEVITSLPNTNIADALGRMPSVSLERDEGEGKYVQIRGTEPRLTNVTVDGVHLPSPESVRNVKLDAIPADLVDSVEINKTLAPSQEGDAIGGSVNLATKRATEQPFLSIEGRGGYTPIGFGGLLDQFGATYGKRFGREKRFGALIGGSYDYNQRGTNDIEPSPGTTSTGNGDFADGVPVFFGMDIREYQFYRHRYGFAGSADYKLGAGSLAYIRGLFSHFIDNGDDWILTPSVGTFASPTLTNADGQVNYSHVVRRPSQRLFNVIAGANHSFGKTLITYEGALGQARSCSLRSIPPIRSHLSLRNSAAPTSSTRRITLSAVPTFTSSGRSRWARKITFSSAILRDLFPWPGSITLARISACGRWDSRSVMVTNRRISLSPLSTSIRMDCCP